MLPRSLNRHWGWGRRERTHVRDLGRIPKATPQIAFVQQSLMVSRKRECTPTGVGMHSLLLVSIQSINFLKSRYSEIDQGFISIKWSLSASVWYSSTVTVKLTGVNTGTPLSGSGCVGGVILGSSGSMIGVFGCGGNQPAPSPNTKV